MRRLIILSLLLILPPLFAQDAEEVPPETKESEASSEQAGAADAPAPEAGNLRSRELGDAFRNFQPSEEISADNAVSFPVDI